MKFILACSLLLISVICSAAIYMQSNNNGEVTYSDVPTQDSKVLNVQDAPTTQFSSPNTASKTTTTTTKTTTTKTTVNSMPVGTDAEAHVPYTAFSITAPVDQQTFQNQRDISVSVDIKPKLQKGDKVLLLLDGRPIGAPVPSTELQVHQLDRGTHSVAVELVDMNQAVLRQAGPVTFFVHYAALGGG